MSTSTISLLLDIARKTRKASLEEAAAALMTGGYTVESARAEARASLKVGVKKAVEHNGYICTLAEAVHRPLSAMLRERFAHSGGWHHAGGELWPSMDDISLLVSSSAFRKLMAGYRRQRKRSAPALFPDEQLSIFSLVNEGRDGITFLVWNKQEEPECWRYGGGKEQKFANLALFLEWFNANEK